MKGHHNVIIGVDNECDHSHCVVIGTGLKTTNDWQILIGNSEINTTRIMTVKEFKELKSFIDELTELFKK